MDTTNTDTADQTAQNTPNTNAGTFIVIEGTDGSGKATQFARLADRLVAEGYDVATFDFPQYDQASSFFVQEYLNGRYGSAEDVGPYTGSLFYALDRYQAAPQIRQALADGKVVLANRFVGSNMAHQGTKFHHVEERRGYFIWLDNLEFEMLRTPRPTLSFVLRVPAETAQNLVDKKAQRSYTDKKRDLHEADLTHMQKAVEVYDDMCQLFPRDFVRIDCVRGNELLEIDVIHELLWQRIKPMLPASKSGKGHLTRPASAAASSLSSAASASMPPAVSAPAAAAPTPPATATHTEIQPHFVEKQADGQYKITLDGQAFLEQAVTNTTGNVYAFRDKLSSVTIAAAMARLSRRGDDMRITILDEFAASQGKDEQLLQRVITAYGDDSVQQLSGVHVVVENASNLLTKKLEWGRLASYLEQSTRYIYFDQKNAKGEYRYFTPDYFPAEIRQQYRSHMDRIFELYSYMVQSTARYITENSTVPAAERDIAFRSAVKAQACDAIRPVLPVATTATVGIFASGQALESLIMHLLSDVMPEARETGEQLLHEARKVAPAFLERADKPERGGAMVAYRANTYGAMAKLAAEQLPATHTTAQEAVQLTDIWPRNELDIVPDMLYEHSDLPLKELRQITSTWTYNQKATVMETYIGERLNRRHRPGRALEKIHYSWDLLCDYGTFRDLQRHRMVDDLEWQQLTPRYGYEIPKLVDEAGLTEQFEACFDLSLKLYSLLQQAGFAQEAQYAVLFGHRMRWKVTYNARQAFHFHELRTSPQGHPAYRRLLQQMHEKLAEVHPTLAESMIFVNQGEDPELTRLAAEKYTQYKLQQLNDSKG